jgi:hypothetical protein
VISTIATVDVTCGRCSTRIQRDEPIARFANGRLVRCAPCAEAMGFPFNGTEVDLERDRLERERRREPRPMAAIGELGRELFDHKVAGGRDAKLAAANEGSSR